MVERFFSLFEADFTGKIMNLKPEPASRRAAARPQIFAHSICQGYELGGGTLAAIFVMLTSIGSRRYTFLVKGGTDSDLKGRDHRLARKSKLL